MSVPQGCPTRVFRKSVPQECPTRLSYKSAPQRVSYKSDCHTTCPTKVSEKNASYKIVPQERLLQECLKLFGYVWVFVFQYVFAFRFVGFRVLPEAYARGLEQHHTPELWIFRFMSMTQSFPRPTF